MTTVRRMTPEERTAPVADAQITGAVTLMNRFHVDPDRDELFLDLWTRTSMYFRKQPGFVSLRLHRAVSADAESRWVNVATWESEADFRAAHNGEEFRLAVTQPGWEHFPSSPMLYQVVTEVAAP
jgi:heme oxygenase (mycobilin-producing)